MRLTFQLLFMALSALPLSLSAQTGNTAPKPCGTVSGRSPWLKKFQSQPELYEKNLDTILYVPLTIHLLATDEGVGFLPINNLLTALCTLNEDFEQANIQFFIEGEINYIANSGWDSHDSVPQGAQMMFANNVPNTLNCYFLTDPAGNAGYNLPYAGIALGKPYLGVGNHTWAHEVGHAFSLPHPFLGWEGGVSHDDSVPHNFNDPAPPYVTYNYTYYKDTLILDTVIIDTALVELVDGSNCLLAADGFCDTSPDYLAGSWFCNAQLESTIVQTDPDSVQFRSDATLIMSYANDNCASRFTPQQIAAMRANLQDEKPNLLYDQTVLPVVSAVPATLTLPAPAETVPFNNVYLEWTPVEAATGYVIQINRLPNFPALLTVEYTVMGSNNTLIFDLENNKTYYWRVRAFSTDHFCTGFSASTSFKTAEISAAENIANAGFLKLYPNPLSGNEVLHLQLAEGDLPNLDEVQLFDLSGKQLWRIAISEMPFTDNAYGINLPAFLTSGLYLLKVRGDQGLWVEKVVIH
jgi:hypothetical protein